MKKISILILLCIVLTTMFGCSSKTSDTDENTTKNNVEEPSQKENNPLAGQSLATFNTVDINENAYTNDDLKDSKLTMINVWATYCPPCLEELPALEKLQDEFKDKDVKIIGLVASEDLELAKKILSEKNITYTNLMPDDALRNQISSAFNFVPVSIFIDEEGNILDEVVAGARDLDGYKEIIENILNKK